MGSACSQQKNNKPVVHPVSIEKCAKDQTERIENSAHLSKETILQAKLRDSHLDDSFTANGHSTKTDLYSKVAMNHAFIDKEFPHVLSSITDDPHHKLYESCFKFAVWKRPHEFLNKKNYAEVKLFDKIDPLDIIQGVLEVCYLLSCLSAIAESPSRIKSIFNTRSSNLQGKYSVTFFLTGVPTEVVVDDHFPCSPDSNELIFSKTQSQELWPLIIEKAWAKIYGCYTAVEYGLMDFVFEDLLGVPASFVSVTVANRENIWIQLKRFIAEKYLLCATTIESLAEDRTGLVTSHAYTVLSVYEDSNLELKLIKLRDPWGIGGWKGAYSNSSVLMNEKLKKLLNYEDKNDGSFYINLDDFTAYFSYFSVCYYKENYHRNYICASHDRGAESFFEFDIEGPCNTNIEILQKDKRFFRGSQYTYSEVEIFLLKKSLEGFEKIAMMRSKGERYVGIEESNEFLNLQAGSYLLVVKTAKNCQFTVSCYAERTISLIKVSEPERQPNNVEYYFLLDLAQKDPKFEEFEERCRWSHGWAESYYYFYLENLGEKIWKFKMTFDELVNVEIKHAYQKGQNFLSAVLQPGQREIMFVRKIDVDEETIIKWSAQQSWL